MARGLEENVHPDIKNIWIASGGQHKPGQQLSCGHPGCDKKLRLICPGEWRTAKAFFAEARKRGWSVIEGQSYRCKEHAPYVKAPTKPAEETMQHTVPTKTDSVQPPREMTPVERRAIFREIDESYETKGYVLGITDQTIAEKLKMPWAWVAKVREENFGPAGPNPKLQKLVTQIEELGKKASAAEDDALKAAQRAEAIAAEVETVKKQLVSLLQGV